MGAETEELVGQGVQETQKVPAKAAGEAAGQQAGAEDGAQGAAEGQTSVSLPGVPEGMSLEQYVAQSVSQVEQRLRDEYEGKGGHMAKLRSSLQKQINELKRQSGGESQRALEAALQVADKDPQQAIGLLAKELEQYQSRDQRSIQELQMQEWVEDVAGKLGLEASDAEVLSVLEEVGSLTEPGADFEAMGRLTLLANQRQQKRAEAAEKKLVEYEQTLEQRISQMVATAMVEKGLKAVDSGEVTKPPVKDENPIAGINNPAKLLALALKDVGRQ